MSPQHHNEECALCKGASQGQKDHYALGRLRIRIARAVGFTQESAQGKYIQDLLDAHAEARYPRLADER